MPEGSPSYARRWVGEVSDWKVVSADLVTSSIGNVAVRGKVLVGPYEGVGGQAFFPPGVPNNTPEDFSAGHTHEGWRHGVWERLQEYEIFQHEQEGYPIEGDFEDIVWVTGKERPLTLSRLEIEKVMQTVKLVAPNNETVRTFMQAQVAIRGAGLWNMLGEQPEERLSHRLKGEFKDLRQAALAAFGGDWVLDNLVFPGDNDLADS
jgi:hypothetical protein